MARYTKIENFVLGLQKKLRPLSAAAIAWVESLHPKRGAYTKGGRVWCQRCGHVEYVDPKILQIDLECSYTCPACGNRLSLHHDPHSKYHHSRIYAFVASVVDGWQVLRFVESDLSVVAGKEAYASTMELWQAWFSPEGKEVIRSRRYQQSPFCGLKWDYMTPITSPRKRRGSRASGYYTYEDPFEAGGAFYPNGKFTRALKMRGLDFDLVQNCSPVAAIERLFLPEFETLAKTQRKLFRYLVRRGDYTVPCWHAVKICNRRSYRIEDASLWYDLLDALGALGLDTHNAHYVCPTDLRDAHDAYIRRRQRAEEKKRREELEREASAANKAYQRAKARFFGIEILGDDLVIRVLPDVAAFRREGEELHHCVFANRYYSKEDALILSARDSRGKAVETIEVSLETFEIVQARGLCNRNSKRHNEILALVNGNMGLIRQAHALQIT